MLDVTQGSEAWYQARCGSLGASAVADALARTKSGWGASRANVAARIIAERLTGVPQESYTNAAMARGTETEPQARAAYAFMHDADVVECGLFPHPKISGTHASPDGLIGDDGLLEIKCPQTATHLDYLLSGKVPSRYVTQINWQLACTGRQWCDFVSFDPRLPADLQLFVRRIERDDAVIAEMEREVEVFLAEVEAKLKALENLRVAA